MLSSKRAILCAVTIIICAVAFVGASRHRRAKETASIKPLPQKLSSAKITTVTQTRDFRDIAVLDNGEMWAIGFEGQYSPMLWHSKDAGNTWEPSTLKDDLPLDTIDFVDSQHGWAVGFYNHLLQTSDGGKTWELTRVPTNSELESISFANTQVGYLVGNTSYKDRKSQRIVLGMEILCTKNSGKSWQVCYKDNKSSGVSGMATLSEKVAVAAVDGNSLLRTEDGGATWQVVAYESWGFLSIVFTPDGIGWAVGRNSFYRSTDGGKTWQTPESLPKSFLSRHWVSINFADAMRGFALAEDGTLVITIDGGQTWSEAEDKIDYRIGRIWLKNNIGIILGHQKIYLLNLISPS